jgi:hypothetical protein
MAKKKLRQCQSGKDFLKYCRKQANIEYGKGSHAKVVTDKGFVVIPHHNKDLGRGLRSVIIKGLVAIGVMGLVAMYVFIQMYG